MKTFSLKRIKRNIVWLGYDHPDVPRLIENVARQLQSGTEGVPDIHEHVRAMVSGEPVGLTLFRHCEDDRASVEFAIDENKLHLVMSLRTVMGVTFDDDSRLLTVDPRVVMKYYSCVSKKDKPGRMPNNN